MRKYHKRNFINFQLRKYVLKHFQNAQDRENSITYIYYWIASPYSKACGIVDRKASNILLIMLE